MALSAAAARTERLEPQVGDRPARAGPGVPRRIQHPHRAAEQSRAPSRQRREQGGEIEPLALIAGMNDAAIAEHRDEFVEVRGVARERTA